MKKTVFWLMTAAMVLLILPLIISSGIRHSHNARNILLVVIIPAFFVILGISVGKSLRKHWYMPVVSLALFFVGNVFILGMKRFLDFESIAVLTVIYLILSAASMLLTAAILKISDRKRILKKAAIVSCIVSGTGFLINLLGYLISKDIPLGITQWGGDYSGKSGFGLLLNRVYPMTKVGDSVPRNTTWLTFEPVSLIMSLVAVFVIALVCLVISALLKHAVYENEDINRTG